MQSNNLLIDRSNAHPAISLERIEMRNQSFINSLAKKMIRKECMQSHAQNEWIISRDGYLIKRD